MSLRSLFGSLLDGAEPASEAPAVKGTAKGGAGQAERNDVEGLEENVRGTGSELGGTENTGVKADSAKVDESASAAGGTKSSRGRLDRQDSDDLEDFMSVSSEPLDNFDRQENPNLNLIYDANRPWTGSKPLLKMTSGTDTMNGGGTVNDVDLEKEEGISNESEADICREIGAFPARLENMSSSQLFKQSHEVLVEKPRFLGIKVRSKGWATLLFVLLFWSLLFIFGFLFMVVEAHAERERNEKYTQMMASISASNISSQVYEELVEFIGIDPETGTQDFVSYTEQDWDVLSAHGFFTGYSYAFYLSTTIGYGDIVTHTPAGRVLTIFAVLITLPIAVVTYTRVADFLSGRAMRLILRSSDEFKTVLKKYDTDKSGELDAEELRLGLRDLGIDLSSEQVSEILTEFDTDRNGVLDVNEFVNLATVLDVQVGKIARQEKKLRFAILALFLSTILYSVMVGFSIVLSPLNSVYFTIITISTVGLGDIQAPIHVRPWLTIPTFLILGLVALVIGSLTENLQPKEARQVRETRTSSAMNSLPPAPSFDSHISHHTECADRAGRHLELPVRPFRGPLERATSDELTSAPHKASFLQITGQ